VSDPSDDLSPYGHIRVEDVDGYRRMWFSRKQQSSMKVGDPFETDLEVHNDLHVALALAPEAERFLVIGLGGGSLAKRLWRDYEGAIVDVVEIDPAVAEVARELFEVTEDERMRIHVQDGRAFLEQSEERYDIIFVDAFADDFVPRPLQSIEFLEICREHLSDGGVVAYNIFGAPRGMYSQPFRRMYRTITEAFEHVWVFLGADDRSPEQIGNVLVLATDLDATTETLTARIGSRVDGRVSVSGFESLAGRLYEDEVDTEDTSVISDTPSWAVPPSPPQQ
jgi:spermidine synthase